MGECSNLGPDSFNFLERKKHGAWEGDPLVVLSLFDGLGAIWQALHNLGIPTIGYSSEVQADAIEVVKQRWPNVKHLGDIKSIEAKDILEKVDLVVGGFPCQDVSAMNRYRPGLHGPRSSLFFELLRIIQVFEPKWFLVENVKSMLWVDREEVTKYLGGRAIEIDSQELTPQSRKRYFWSNIPLPSPLPSLRDHPSTQLQHVLEDAVALDRKCRCILLTNFRLQNSSVNAVLCKKTEEKRCLKIGEIEQIFGLPRGYTNVHFPPKSREKNKGDDSFQEKGDEKKNETIASSFESFEKQETDPIALKQEKGEEGEEGEEEKEGDGIQEIVCKKQKKNISESVGICTSRRASLRSFSKEKMDLNSMGNGILKGDEVRLEEKRKMGKGDNNQQRRWSLLGNSFPVPVISFFCSSFLDSNIRNKASPYKLPETVPQIVKEEKFAILQPGEIWALYNENKIPNWYGLIVSRKGGRFSQNTEKLEIVVKYLTFIDSYGKLEEDWDPKTRDSGWTPSRGTGAYRLTDKHEVFDNFLVFSHRVPKYLKFEDEPEDIFFIYPLKDSIWVLRDKAKTNTSSHVYVKEIQMCEDNPRKFVDRKEKFSAQVQYLTRRSGMEYRFSNYEVKITDLSRFMYEAPYLFRNDRNTFIVEPHSFRDKKEQEEDEEEDDSSFQQKKI